jgi:hypothetical protein
LEHVPCTYFISWICVNCYLDPHPPHRRIIFAAMLSVFVDHITSSNNVCVPLLYHFASLEKVGQRGICIAERVTFRHMMYFYRLLQIVCKEQNSVDLSISYISYLEER